MTISNPVMFMANERETAEEAIAGDIIGIPNHGQIRLGDTFTEGEKVQFTGLPIFAPEFLRTVRSLDPLKSKHLEKALTQFAEEGTSKLFKPVIGSGWVVGVVGVLQFEVLESRIKDEYGLPVKFENSPFTSARWLKGASQEIAKFSAENKSHMATDHDKDPVFLTRIQWDIDRVKRDYPNVELISTKEMKLNDVSLT